MLVAGDLKTSFLEMCGKIVDPPNLGEDDENCSGRRGMIMGRTRGNRKTYSLFGITPFKNAPSCTFAASSAEAVLGNLLSQSRSTHCRYPPGSTRCSLVEYSLLSNPRPWNEGVPHATPQPYHDFHSIFCRGTEKERRVTHSTFPSNSPPQNPHHYHY